MVNDPLLPDSFAALLQAAKDGDQAALTDLFEREKLLIRRRAKLVLENPADVDDVEQATFLKVSQGIGRLESLRPEVWRSWVLTIAKHAALDVARKKKTMPDPLPGTSSHAFDPAGGSSSSPSRKAMTRELEEALHNGLEQLAADDRLALTMRMQDKTMRQIALALGLSEVAVKKRVSRAYERLRAFMKDVAPSEWIKP